MSLAKIVTAEECLRIKSAMIIDNNAYNQNKETNNMRQLQMFKNVRRNDSDTSFAAAASMETAAKRYKAIVYRTLLHFGPMTSEEIASRCELDHPQVWRRVSDLRRDNVIHDTGERRKNRSGRRAGVWAVNKET